MISANKNQPSKLQFNSLTKRGFNREALSVVSEEEGREIVGKMR
jgi:hypothetical protein